MSDTESEGVGWMIAVVSASNSLKPFFDYHDKTPSWDGFIFVYEDNLKKNHLIGRVPVQIKSEKVTELNNGKVSFPFEVEDLKNYYKDGGVILFVVQIIDQFEKKIFFSSLLPSDLKEIMNSCDSNQGYKSIWLYELDITKLSNLETICRNFLKHRKLQFSTSEVSISHAKEAKEFMMTGITINMPIEKYLLDYPQYLYGKEHQDETPFLVDKIYIKEIVEQINREISIDSQRYYENYKVVHNKEEVIVRFGEGLSWNLNTKKITNSFRGTLAGQINDDEFIIKLFYSKYFQIGDQRIVTELEGNGFITQIENRLNLLNDVKALLTIFRIDPFELDMDQIDENSNKILSVLIDVMVYNKKTTKIPIPNGIKYARIGNINLGIIIYQREDDSLLIEDLFGQVTQFHFTYGDDEQRVLISPYILLNSDFLLTINNLHLDEIVSSVKRVEFSSIYAEPAINFILELIHSYDKTNKNDFLNTAMEINDWLHNNEKENQIHVINKYQIIRRNRDLTIEEKEILNSMKHDVDNRLFCGISILLENKSDFQISFNKLTSEEKNKFYEYPIFNLAKKLFEDGTIISH